jgi:RHS repeat-associated protein
MPTIQRDACARNMFRQPHRYTGKERDAESGNDYFGARYMASGIGRFLTPDDGSDQDASDPQSWNLYAYVRNNPLILTDPDGRGACDDKTSFTTFFNDVFQSYSSKTTPHDCPDVSLTSALADLLFQRGQQAVSNAAHAAQQVANYLTAPRDPGCMAGFAGGGGALGAGIGAVGAGAVGATGGTLVAPGVGTVGGGIVLSGAGAWTGTQIGTVAGASVGYFACASGGGGGSGGGSKFGSNQRENKMANDAKKDAERQTGKKFNSALDRKFHDEITGQGNKDYHELVQIAVDVLEGHI